MMWGDSVYYTMSRHCQGKMGSCTEGLQRTADGSSCEQCPVGHFSSEEGAAPCFPCQAGTFCDEKGCTSCTSCQPGKETASEGLGKCSECRPGMFSEMSGHFNDSNGNSLGQSSAAKSTPIICQNCTRGMFQRDRKVKDRCDVCEPGGYAGPGWAQCKQCPNGRQVSAGQDGCEICTVGKVQNALSEISKESRRCEYHCR